MVASTDNFKLLNKIYQKSVSPVKKKKMKSEHHHRIIHICIPHFNLKKQF